MSRKRSLTVAGRFDQLGPICEFVTGEAEKAGFDEDAVFHVQLACDEACTNVIEHAYGEEDAGDITVSCQVRGEDFVIVIEDHGRPFDPANVPSPHLPGHGDEVEKLKVGGLGIHFMHKLMDEVRFNFNQDGNTLVMVKHLPKEGEG